MIPKGAARKNSRCARLTDTLVRREASVIVFDMILDTPGNSVEDSTLATSIRDTGRDGT